MPPSFCSQDYAIVIFGRERRVRMPACSTESSSEIVEGLAVNPQNQIQKQRWLGYHCPFFADLSSVGRSRYRTSMYTSLSSHLAALSRASYLPIRRLKQSKNPLLRTLPDQSADLALNRLVVKTCCQAVSLWLMPCFPFARAQSPFSGHLRSSLPCYHSRLT